MIPLLNHEQRHFGQENLNSSSESERYVTGASRWRGSRNRCRVKAGEKHRSICHRVKVAVRPRDLQRAMLEVEPQIVHFSGHGAGDEGLVFEDEIGQRYPQGSWGTNRKPLDGSQFSNGTGTVSQYWVSQNRKQVIVAGVTFLVAITGLILGKFPPFNKTPNPSPTLSHGSSPKQTSTPKCPVDKLKADKFEEKGKTNFNNIGLTHWQSGKRVYW